MDILSDILFGIISVIIGTILGYLVGKFGSVDLPPVCEDWNKNYIMEMTLFATGFMTKFIYDLF